MGGTAAGTAEPVPSAPLLQALLELQRAALLLRALLATAARSARRNAAAAAAVATRRLGGSGGCAALPGPHMREVALKMVGDSVLDGDKGSGWGGGALLRPLGAADAEALSGDEAGWAARAAGLLAEAIKALLPYGLAAGAEDG
jgi:hypothetical protein